MTSICIVSNLYCFINFFYLFMCPCAYIAHVEGREQVAGLGSFLLPCGLQGLNSGPLGLVDVKYLYLPSHRTSPWLDFNSDNFHPTYGFPYFPRTVCSLANIDRPLPLPLQTIVKESTNPSTFIPNYLRENRTRKIFPSERKIWRRKITVLSWRPHVRSFRVYFVELPGRVEKTEGAVRWA